MHYIMGTIQLLKSFCDTQYASFAWSLSSFTQGTFVFTLVNNTCIIDITYVGMVRVIIYIYVSFVFHSNGMGLARKM